jgi:hypothetical protein
MSVCTFQLKQTYIKHAVWGPHFESLNKRTSCKTVFPGLEVPGYKDCLCKIFEVPQQLPTESH